MNIIKYIYVAYFHAKEYGQLCKVVKIIILELLICSSCGGVTIR